MKRPALPPAPARLPRRSFAKAGALAHALGLFLLLSVTSQLQAQVGDNNPSGASGIFNGQAGGCGYDPYTGNATRSITDMAVAGAVGEYPLALVRTANSRTPSTTEVFGWAGGWNHSYNWILEDSPSSTNQNFQPSSYTVDFPDGRVETFRSVTWDTANYYRVRAAPGDNASTSAGVRERFVPLSGGFCYLILPDGGKVKFQAMLHASGSRYYYKYSATAIIDPYGLSTTLQWEVVGTNHLWRLVWVIDPSGQRNLHFTYNGNGPRIASVTASDGRSVNYYYIYCNGCRLDRVRYYNNAAWDARYQYTNSNIGGELPPLLWTADDPMYPGPMKRIAYEYKTGTNADQRAAVYGQMLRERYWDGVLQHEGSGAIVSTLTVGAANPINHNIRTETRGDNVTRTFIYNGAGYVTWVSDFMGHQSTQGYDTYKYINSVIDFNRNETNYTCDPITGNVTQIKYPLTPDDTPNQGVRPTVNYNYTNNYYLHTIQAEGGQTQTTTFNRYGDNRIASIVYPDGGWESFTYDASHFYQLSSHRMTTGGTETFAYDWRHRKQYYSDPYHNNANNPSIQYFYDAWDRVSGVLDALNHASNWDYNDRGQIIMTTLPWYNGTRYTITNTYNADGTLQSKTDELGHLTGYTYDDYRRLKSVTAPLRGDGTGTHTTIYNYWIGNWISDDYRYTDSSVCWVVLPSGKKIKTVYDDNRRKSTVTVAPGTADQATASYGYDGMGNVTRGTNPRGYATTTVYDERNRPSSITEPTNRTTAFTYDTAGRKKSITGPNGQVITYVSFDEMNRVLQQNVTQTPTGLAITKYEYHPSGLLYTMQDPRLVATQSSETYSYLYDLVGRKTRVTYPVDSGVRRNEQWSYDTAGRLQTFTNRAGQAQTFNYDALNRMTGFSWDDTPRTPSVTFGYDAGSRLTDINNANATISRIYWNDNLLRTETETPTGPGGIARSVSYTYNADGNPDTLQIPGYTFSYTYTGRKQLKDIKNGATTLATYGYDETGYVGDLTSRVLANGTRTYYLYDPLDRVTWITHALNGTSRGFNYGYHDNSNNRKYVRRTGSTQGDVGDVFSYDLNDQVTAVKLDISNPTTADPGNQTIFYDPNGNRNWFSPPGHSEQYVINNLNQYTSRNSYGNSYNATYDAKGNLTISPDAPANGSTYTYDAQNRLTSATKSGVTETFKYDGLNRQVSRTVGGITTYSVWNGWNLVQEYKTGPTVTASYLYGATGLVKNLLTNNYYYQDGSGSTSHLATSGGALLEWYRYDLQGTPFFYNASDQMIGGSNAGVRHLFTGQQWYSELGLYHLRNRFYSPDTGRFLQPDPIGFRGDRSNLYRYCGNNPVTRWDPFGLNYPTASELGSDPEVTYDGQTPDDWLEWAGNQPGPGGGQGPNVVVNGGPNGGDYGGSPGGVSGGVPGGLVGGIPGAMFYGTNASGGPSEGGGPGLGGRTLANSAAATPLGKFLQSFNSQGGWNETASALDAFAAFEASLLTLGEGQVMWGVGRLALAPSAIQTAYVTEVTSTSLEARLAISAVRNGATLHRAGELGESMAGESQYWSLQNPISPGYASQMGMPGVRVNFIMGGTLNPGTSAIANEAAALGANPGAGIQIVTSPNGVGNLWFYMP
jgi:RHS repeat-associated protein